MTADLLAQIPLFAGLADADLQQLRHLAREITVPAGKAIIEEGAEGTAMYVVLDGELDVTRSSGDHEVHLRTLGPHAFVGEMAFLAGGIRSATVRATTECRLLMIDENAVEQLLSTNASAAVTMLRTVMERVASTEDLLVHHHKLASLGTLAAGIAHELNNPVAAMSRTAAHLRTSLFSWQEVAQTVGSLMDDAKVRDVVARIQAELAERPPSSAMLDPVTRSDREDQISDWLASHGVRDGWKLAETFVDAGWDVDKLEELSTEVDDQHLPVVIEWIGAGLNCRRLITDIEMATTRVSDLVSSVRGYVNLDRAPIQNVDIHEGIRSSLLLLRHKLGTVRVIEDFDPGLPSVEAFQGELNQVWTNLIDNALDALAGSGELTIRTGQSGQSVVVEICDTGPGIPEHVRQRIFDPFFTTKAPGAGTGLGLHITYNLVVERHHGDITIDSRPGRNCVQVKLPIRVETD